ncbi:MAG TPA: poly-gamma-glutamate hydrolase family protein [Nitrososphaeraceae archaeon]|jgi:phage replication-related protein YjqB (UPF0714/DUF867 family)
MSNTQGFFNAKFEVDSADPHKEQCWANGGQITDIGRNPGEQVRIEFPRANTNTILGAIFTVSPQFLSDLDRVVLGKRIVKLDNCQLSGSVCNGQVKAQIMIEGLEQNEEQAKNMAELIEKLSHNPQNHKLVVLAPHGGNIEPWTDVEAEYVANQFGDRASLWSCKGFSSRKPNGESNEDASERWHITSTQISEKSFPKLNTIIGDNPTFDYSIAFHGWTEDSICVGGNPHNPDADLKCDIRGAIMKALEQANPDIKVHVSPCPDGNFNGDSPENIVNRLGTNSIQIEQCKIARTKYHDAIAKAVVDVIGTRINA